MIKQTFCVVDIFNYIDKYKSLGLMQVRIPVLKFISSSHWRCVVYGLPQNHHIICRLTHKTLDIIFKSLLFCKSIDNCYGKAYRRTDIQTTQRYCYQEFNLFAVYKDGESSLYP